MIIRRKTLHICSPQLGLAPKSILGGEVFDREILLGLAKRGVKIDIILPKNKEHDKNITNFSISTLPIKSFPAFLGNVLYLPGLFTLNKKNKIKILRLHQPQFLGITAFILKITNPNVKSIATYHKFEESLFGPFSKLINNLWDHIVCDSYYVKAKLVKAYQIKPSNISVVHNGVPNYLKPFQKNEKLVKKYNLQGKIVLLFMGLFDARKNPLFLLDVLKKINDKRIVVLFWGNGPQKDEIKNKAAKMGLNDQIRILDPIYGPNKNKIHNLADIFVHPSLDEGFALTPLESMACAKPVIITDGYSSSEVVTGGENGFLCKVNDTNQWQQNISKLIKDIQLRKKMGENSRSKVSKKFQWKLAVDIHFKIIKSLTR